MIVINFIQSGKTLKGEFGINPKNSLSNGIKVSPEYVIIRSVKLQFKMKIETPPETSSFCFDKSKKNTTFSIFVRFDKLHRRDDTHRVKLTSNKLEITDEIFSVSSNPGIYHVLDDVSPVSIFDVSITLLDPPMIRPFASLHDDNLMTDFELRGENGSVRVHKAILASSSPVFRRMFEGVWKESTKGVVDMPGTTRASLQHFKDFIYLGTLPSTGLEHLLALSSCYLIPDLERKCVANLQKNLTAQNTVTYLKLAVRHNLDTLLVEISHFIRCGDVNVDEMEDYLFPSEPKAKHAKKR